MIDESIKENIPVAIIGMGCFFPGSSGLKEYWRLLFQGEDAITDIPETHWSPGDYYDPDPRKSDYVYCKRGGFLSPVSFDPAEFGITPSSLEATDTSQLLGLMATKMALEDAGYGDGRPFDRDKTSVILGVTGTQELVIPLSSRLGYPIWRKALEDAGVAPGKTEEIIERISDSYVSWQENSFPGLLGNVVAGRIANRLDLGGTNCVVDAACASSFSAIHLSLMELISGRSDMVVTGGVDTLNDIFMHICFARTQTLSPTGDARPFSKNADGTVLGEGVGILILKRLADAEKDGDRIYAVIKGLGSSSDGKSQSIYAPGVEGQRKALRRAYETAGIEPATIELIEAHGTGTKVGDQVEFQALSRFFGESGANDNRCAVGSVKSMIGHTKAAAGAAGIIKTALSLYNKVLPPTLKAEEPDPGLGIDESPFYLSTETRPWLSRKEHPRRAGVSAFGFGGSNFHIVLEEHRAKKSEIAWEGSVEIVALSASSRKELLKQLQEFKSLTDEKSSFRDISAKAAETRSAFSKEDPYRLLLVLEQNSDISRLFADTLNALEKNRQENEWNLNNIYHGGPEKPDKLAFVFPGQGSQYVGMGRDLLCIYPEAFNILENADEQYKGSHALSDFIYPRTAVTEEEKKVYEDRLRQTDVAQPAIGAVSLSMLKILQGFGIEPDATCGHSFGELTALCAAGRLDIDTLILIAIARGKLMAASGKDRGTMLAVNAPLEDLDKLIEKSIPGVVLANRNSPNQGVLSGPIEVIAEAEAVCKKQKFRTVRLPVSAAFHSSLVMDAKQPFIDVLSTIDIKPSHIPVFSNTTGEQYPADPDKAKELLGNHLLCPVDFVSEIENLYKSGVRTFVEVGPKSVLTGLVRSILKGRSFQAVSLDGSSGKRSSVADLARILCHLASLGHHVELNRWEQSVSTSSKRKQLMSIPISGTNYRNQKNQPVKSRREKTAEARKTTPIRPQHTLLPGDVLKETSSGINDTTGTINTMDKDKRYQPDIISGALSVVQEGLKSMETLQRQTAEAHKMFLETQTEAGRTLQKMMDHIQQLTGASAGLDNTVFDFGHKPRQEQNDEQIRPSDNKPINPVRANDIQEIAPAPEMPVEITDNAFTPPESEPDDRERARTYAGKQEIEQTMLALVSELTGYPVEMLGLDMDIESDLGIDSIKRVEILSTLEEKMPDLPVIPPEIAGSLKTLGQVIDHLFNKSNGMSVSAVSETGNRGKNASIASGSEEEDSNHNELKDIMLSVVSELTGYPIEMLGLDMDIEADLGIDSIKRVEILSTLEEKMPGLPVISPEIAGNLKTLGQIIGYLAGASKDDLPQNDTKDIRPERLKEPEPEKSNAEIERKIVSIVEKPMNQEERISIPPGRHIYVTDDKTGLSEAIVEEFAGQNIDAVLLPQDILKSGKKISAAGGLVILADSRQADKTGINRADEAFLKEAFILANRLAPDLLDAAEKGGAVFATVTRLDGAFGFKEKGMAHPIMGGLAGLAKTAAIEWKKVCCHAIDVAPDWESKKEIAKAVVAELLNPTFSGSIEVGLDPILASGTRFELELESSPSPQGNIDLSPDNVVIVTGGARGITASVVRALAKHSNPTLVLLGRSPHPSPEPNWLQSLEDVSAIKQAIIENEFNGKPVSLKQVEKAFKKHMANREILENLERLRKDGNTVFYYPADVRDPVAVSSVVDDVRLAHGPIRGIIHGAGVLEDRLIIDKTIEQFEIVFDTKVRGLNVLLEATRQDNLKYLVLFSSISARIGNRGQVDYAMANEALNKIAQQESITRPDCKVISINWGPWDGGMVSPGLKKEFARNNISLIPIDAGTRFMLNEMMGDKRSPVEVVAGVNIDAWKEKKKAETPELKKEELKLTFKREIDVDHYPILESHILDRKPVMPFALMMEWIGHGALHENPGLLLHGFDDMRLLNGIKLDRERSTVRLLSGTARKKGSFFEVAVEIRNGSKSDGVDLVHYKAKAILADGPVQPPLYDKDPYIDSGSYPRSIDEVYEKILFHGSGLRGIAKIISCSSSAMAAELFPAPLPDKWMKDPLRSRWIGDPLVLDSAFQMATVWCYEEKGMVSLPSYSACYRQYCKRFPSGGVTAVLEIRDTTDNKMKCDFTFLDSDELVVARLTGYEAVMDASLYKAFKPQYAV